MDRESTLKLFGEWLYVSDRMKVASGSGWLSLREHLLREQVVILTKFDYNHY